MAKSEIVNRKSKIYRHIFFDLDHTIWDFDKNAEETLHELYEIYRLHEIGVPAAPIFIETYTRNNHQLWAEYHTGKITKTELRETRFKRTFIELGVHPDILPVAFEDDYVKLCPTKTNLFHNINSTLKINRFLLPNQVSVNIFFSFFQIGPSLFLL